MIEACQQLIFKNFIDIRLFVYWLQAICCKIGIFIFMKHSLLKKKTGSSDCSAYFNETQVDWYTKYLKDKLHNKSFKSEMWIRYHLIDSCLNWKPVADKLCRSFLTKKKFSVARFFAFSMHQTQERKFQALEYCFLTGFFLLLFRLSIRK